MLFDYSKADADSVSEAVETAISRSEALIDGIVSVSGDRTLGNTMKPLEEVIRLGAIAYGQGPFLGQVAQDEEVRVAARAGEERLEKWGLDLISRRDLYEAVRDFSTRADVDISLNPAEEDDMVGEYARALEFALRDFRLAGHELSASDRARVQKLKSRLVTLGVKFSAALAEYEDYLEVSHQDLAGMSDSYIAQLKAGESEGTYRITMSYPDVIPFMENSPRRDLREKLAFKFGNRAREENTPILQEVLSLRARIAELFGVGSWAHYGMVTKMALSPEVVEAFYQSIEAPLTEAALLELEAMGRILEADGHPLPLQPWDRAYCHTEQLKREYQVDPLEVAAYFPLEQVVDGMFGITAQVFGLRYQPIEAPVWHPEVKAYRITDTASGELLAHFYMDLHPREGKFGHAAAFPLAPSGLDLEGASHRPVSAMVANLTRPTDEAPALLLHDEVVTLFHEFGHILHMSLSKANLARFSGSRTEWDFVEAPSQIMENWCWIPEVLERFARHHVTGEAIPSDLVSRLAEARNLNVGLFNLRQIMLGSIDMELHTTLNPVDLEDVLRQKSAIGLVPHHEGTFMPASFGHLLGGYDAGYYGYLWAEVFGQDMFSRFSEKGVLSAEVGMEYRRKVLEPGGTKDAHDLLVDFLGRAPENEAFFRKLGLGGC
ncbi:MAG: Zn-dependent oligopeptidase [bacterium]|nr:Zn-dependent oligopeptidase [bacterium]MDE0642772.1 Zn-dependent oligopeptidase [bacterium]MYD05025.1 Zn-dependent oligopeptidase [Acidimicrobiia bacterium]